MEERLDDAINVLRSHCEPQLNMPIGSAMDGNLSGGHSSFANNVPTQQPQQQTVGLSQAQMPQDAAVIPDIPVKVERTSGPSISMFKLCYLNRINL